MSTNSIVQGEQVAQLWPTLFRAGVEIAFAHRTFVWPGRAAVHCVIVGLAPRGNEPGEKRLYSYVNGKGEPAETHHLALTAYLFEAKIADRHLVVKEEARPINGAVRVIAGSQPIDGGNYIFDAEQRRSFLEKEPDATQLMKPILGSEEYLNGGSRWVLDLTEAAPHELRSMPLVRERIRAVRDFRLSSRRKQTLLAADRAESLASRVAPKEPYLVFPKVSSERRDYVPIGWVEPPTIPTDLLFVLTHAQLYDFAVLTSRFHMAWLRHLGGRLKSDYRYSLSLIYNTFPWPDATPAQRAQVEALAQAVLDARALPKNATSTLADLYDPDTMPAELRRAHRELDLAVDRLYRRAPFGSDRERVEHLFTLYQRLVDPLGNDGARQNRRVARRRARDDDAAIATPPAEAND